MKLDEAGTVAVAQATTTVEARVSSAFLILLVEDNPADVDLIQDSFAEGHIHVNVDVAVNGEEAVEYLARKAGSHDAARPQLVLLDLNLPRLDGRQVLAEIKTSGDLRHIPVVVLSSSTAERDVVESYELGASCYLAKPLDLDSYRKMVRAIESFWLRMAKLPPPSISSKVTARAKQ